MFFVFLVDLSKATLRSYTSICDGIINTIETFFHIVYLVLYLIGLRNRSIKGFQFKTNLIQPASRLLQYFTSAWKIAFAFFLQTLPTDQDKDSQAGLFLGSPEGWATKTSILSRICDCYNLEQLMKYIHTRNLMIYVL